MTTNALLAKVLIAAIVIIIGINLALFFTAYNRTSSSTSPTTIASTSETSSSTSAFTSTSYSSTSTISTSSAPSSSSSITSTATTSTNASTTTSTSTSISSTSTTTISQTSRSYFATQLPQQAFMFEYQADIGKVYPNNISNVQYMQIASQLLNLTGGSAWFFRISQVEIFKNGTTSTVNQTALNEVANFVGQMKHLPDYNNKTFIFGLLELGPPNETTLEQQISTYINDVGMTGIYLDGAQNWQGSGTKYKDVLTWATKTYPNVAFVVNGRQLDNSSKPSDVDPRYSNNMFIAISPTTSANNQNLTFNTAAFELANAYNYSHRIFTFFRSEYSNLTEVPYQVFGNENTSTQDRILAYYRQAELQYGVVFQWPIIGSFYYSYQYGHDVFYNSQANGFSPSDTYNYILNLLRQNLTYQAFSYPNSSRWIRIRTLSEGSGWTDPNFNAQQVLAMLKALKPTVLERYIEGAQNPNKTVPGNQSMNVAQFLNASELACNCTIIPRLTLDYPPGKFLNASESLISLPLVHRLKYINLDNTGPYWQTHNASQIQAMFQELYAQGWQGVGLNDCSGNEPTYGFAVEASFCISTSDWTPDISALESLKGDANLKVFTMYIDFPGQIGQFEQLSVKNEAKVLINNVTPEQSEYGFHFVYPILQGNWSAMNRTLVNGTSLYTIMEDLMKQYN